MLCFSAMVIGLCEGVADDLYGSGPMVGSLTRCAPTGFSPYLPSRIRAFAGSQAELVSGSRRSWLWSSSRPGLLPARSRCFPRRWTGSWTRPLPSPPSSACATPSAHDHRFGHGKGEAVAGFTHATALAGAALALAAQSAERLFFPEPIQLIGLGLVVIVASLIAAAGLVVMQTWVVRRTGSTAIAADRAHYVTDVVVNVAVLAALGVTRLTGWERVDPVFAMAISGYMLWNGRGIALEALEQLLDHELPPEERQRIKDTVLACPDVRGLHDLRTRYAGDRIFVEFHLEVDGRLTIDEGHAVGDAAERSVARLFPSTAGVTAHLEPAGIDDERLDDRVASVRNS
jgi:ferrous-iron efflux pump FieF